MSKLMIRWLGILTAALLAALALLHVFWAAGGSWGCASAVPTAGGGGRVFDPSPLGTLAVAAALLAAALIMLGRLGIWAGPLPAWVFVCGTWGISLAFSARAVGEFKYVGLFKRVRDTDFAVRDTWVFTPLSLFVAASAFIINYS